jgi:drug/metabolite transporter (DMT)-like permease
MLAVALGLSSSVCWGLADFLGGLQSRRVPVLAVMLVSQATGLVAIAAWVALGDTAAPGLDDLWPAAAAGLAGALALTAFYRALAIGTMSIVAPISATGAAVPVLVGVAGGERPGALQVLGIVAAVVGVVLASREEDRDPSAGRRAPARTSVALALVAAVGIGAFLTGIDKASDASVPWALLSARAVSVAATAIAVVATRTRIPTAPPRLGLLAATGLLDSGANLLYALGTTEGLLSVVAVLGSLYPVSTVLLARALLGERVRRVQEAGIVAALAGVVLIAAG